MLQESRSTCTFEVKLCERLRDGRQGRWVTIQNQRWKPFHHSVTKGILKATLSFLVWEWDLRSGSEVGSLYIIIKLKKDEASKSVKSLYFNGKLTCIWTGAQQKLVDRYKRYGDLSNTWEPKVKTIFFYAKACNHVAFRVSHSLRYEESVLKKNLVWNWVKHTNRYMQTSTVLFLPLCFRFIASNLTC